MSQRILIKNGTLVTESGSFRADLLVKGEKIEAVGQRLIADDARVLDAEGKLVFPGIVDAHVQLEMGYRDTMMTDNFETGSKAAAAGGVTTLIDFAVQKKNTSILDTLAARRDQAERCISVDYSLHLGFTDVNDANLEQVQDVVDAGVPSFKIYMTYSNRGRMVSGGRMLDVMKHVVRAGGMVDVHAENDPIVVYENEKLLRKGKTAVKYFPLSRPLLAEIIAFQSAISMAEETGCPLYFHHTSSGKGVELIKSAREQGLEVYGETCPPYLQFTESKYQDEDGYQFIVNPPLRDQSDQDRLWRGLLEGSLDVVGTDHCSYNLAHKKDNKDNFDSIPAGFPGIETLLSTMYTIGVKQRNMPLSRLVSVLSAKPSKIFGLYPQKGSFQIGTDADLVIFDPHSQWTLNPDKLFMNVDFHPFAGMTMWGQTETTMVRGRPVFTNGKLAETGKGRFVEASLKGGGNGHV